MDPMKVFKNAADTEPPKESIPAGETALTMRKSLKSQLQMTNIW